MPYDTKYALIDIATFTKKAAMVEGVYQYIIQSAWAATSLTASNFLGVGMTGIPPVDLNNSQFIYTAWINGSTYIENFCLLNDNVSISKSLEITHDLLVSGNTTFTNLYLNNISIQGNIDINNNADISNNLHVHNNTYLNNLNVNNTSLNLLNVSGLAVFNNVSIEDVTIMNASIENVSINNVSIINATINNVSINNATITNASINYVNINTATIHSLDVQNISTNNFSSTYANIINASFINASFNNIYVTQNVSISNTLDATTINATNISNSRNIFSNNISINNNASFNNVTILGQTTLYADKKNNTQLIISNTGATNVTPPSATTSDVYIFPPTFINTLYANIIYCNTVRASNASLVTYDNIARLSIYKQINPLVDGVLQLGIITDPILYTAYTCGAISHGLGNTIQTIKNTFDLSANSNSIGIMYNGPVNIGTNTPNVFNLNATGNMSYAGVVDITGSLLVNGNVSITNDILLGGNITSYSDIKLKNNITKLTECLNKIDHINGYSYTRNDLSDINKTYIGLIAQEVETMYPEIVENNDTIKSINYQSIIAILVECVKELKCEINKLKS